ncbi:MFS transporter [bacterium]|nr:MFS transporter [bacterium]
MFSKNVKKFILHGFIAMVGIGILKPIIPILLRNQGVSAFLIGLTTSLYMIARAISSSYNGILWDKKVNFSKIISYCFLIIAFITFIYFPFHTIIAFFILRPIQGIMAGILWPIIQIETMVQAKEKSNKAISMYFVGGNLGGIVGIFLSALLIFLFKMFLGDNEMSFFPYFFLITGFVFLYLFFFSKTLIYSNDIKEQNKNEDNSAIDPITNNKSIYIAVLISVFINGLVLSVMNAIIIIYIKEIYGFTTFLTTVTYGILVLTSLFFMYFVNSNVSVKNWRIKTLSTYSLLTIVLLLFYFPVNKFIIFFLLILLFILTKINSPLSRNLLKLLCNKKFGKKIGLLNTLQNLGVFFGGMISGFIYDKASNKLLSFPIFGILMFFALLIFITAIFRRHTLK